MSRRDVAAAAAAAAARESARGSGLMTASTAGAGSGMALRDGYTGLDSSIGCSEHPS